MENDFFQIHYTKQRLLYLLKEQFAMEESVSPTLRTADENLLKMYQNIDRQKDIAIMEEAKCLIELLSEKHQFP